MANANVTDVSQLLGREVVLTHRHAGFDFEHRGRVIAVVSALPGSRASSSLMLDEGPARCDYFDLDEIVIEAVL